MGCLAELIGWLLGNIIWYLFIYPILLIVSLLKRTGLIWSVSFYLITEFMFLDTFIQDYRTVITLFLLIPVVIKFIQKIKDIHFNIKWWFTQRDMKKLGFNGNADELEEYFSIKKEMEIDKITEEKIDEERRKKQFKEEAEQQENELDTEKDFYIDKVDGIPIKENELDITLREFLQTKKDRKEQDYAQEQKD